MPSFVAVIVLAPALPNVTLPVQIPSSVNSVSTRDAGSIVPSSTDKAVAPEISVVMLLSESFAVIVTEKATPAIPDVGASTSKLANSPAAMFIASEPVLPLFVAVIVLDPAFVSVTSPVQTPSSVNWASAMEVGSIVPSSTDKAVAPDTWVVVLPSASLAVIVTEKTVPALPDAGASTSKRSN